MAEDYYIPVLNEIVSHISSGLTYEIRSGPFRGHDNHSWFLCVSTSERKPATIAISSYKLRPLPKEETITLKGTPEQCAEVRATTSMEVI